MTTWWPYARLAAAMLCGAAIVTQLARTVQNAMETGGHLPTVVANFFSFFTIESNILAAVALSVGAIWAWTGNRGEREPQWLAALLICASTYMIVTGIVYNLLLRGIELPQGSTVPWSNEVLHVVIPLIMLADVLFAPHRRALPWNAMLITVAFPIVWAAYTLIRGELITAPATGEPWWYPYPFLDPHIQGGYLGVALYVVGIAVAIIGVAALVIRVGRRRGLRMVTSVSDGGSSSRSSAPGSRSEQRERHDRNAI
ncbi:hypothetical protein GCM10025768_01240 [Microbacterium pseudoresistens]|uniref:Cytochrome c biogenesis protein CcdA n=1 Tax=Microbacterium pseudoresistens TaxID=640634 RepID=A0A7Y9EUC3_9MICO|nr:Pr6Pr family membrane protein [Microbacterium pseudoresistens]NYD53959.1 cytochrome c biogenesis protein CcdA [Microbacterium pseudoresistens]